MCHYFQELKLVLKMVYFLACKEELDLEGAQSIFKNFDPLFSVIVYFDQLEYEDLHYVFDEILVRSKNVIYFLIILCFLIQNDAFYHDILVMIYFNILALFFKFQTNSQSQLPFNVEFKITDF